MKPRANIERQLAHRFSPAARFRISRGLLQSDVAIRAGLHPDTVGLIERGVRRASDHHLRRLAKALATTLHRARLLAAQSRAWARNESDRKAGRS
jgi:transcriptional regulator with XRE-family HTH domain